MLLSLLEDIIMLLSLLEDISGPGLMSRKFYGGCESHMMISRIS